jgi:periodic tryptophan protein 1
VAWNPHEPKVLLTSSFDKTAACVDMASGKVVTFPLASETESALWCPHEQGCFYASSDRGSVEKFSVAQAIAAKKGAVKPVFTIHAHDGPVSALAVSPTIPGLIATGSTDKIVKLWSVENNVPTCLLSRDFNMGPIFCLSFSPDDDLLLAIAGGLGKVVIFDATENGEIARRYQGKGKGAKAELPKGGRGAAYSGLDGDEEIEGTLQSFDAMHVEARAGGRTHADMNNSGSDEEMSGQPMEEEGSKKKKDKKKKK